MRAFFVVVIATVFLMTFSFPRAANAETWLAPVGGRPLALGAERVVCKDSGPEFGWSVDPGGRGLVPPTREDSVGQTTTVRVAPNEAACTASATSLSLGTIGARPTVDALTADVESGRVIVRGKRLRGAVLRWKIADRDGADTCAAPDRAEDDATCTFAIPRDLPADPTLLSFWVLPAGARLGSDVIFFDAAGRRAVPPNAVTPTEIDVSRLVPADASVDVSQGAGRVPLTHPEAIGSLWCVDANCDLDGRELVVRGERGPDDKLDVHVQLRPHVVFRSPTGTETAPVVTLPLQRCPVSLASAALVGSADETRIVVRVEGSCARTESELSISTLGGPAKLERTELVAGALLLVARTPRVESSSETITVRRRGTVLGATRVPVRRLVFRPRVELDDGTVLDFIPTNRWARVRMPAAPSGSAFELRPIEGVYDVRRDESGIDWIRATEGASGSTAIRLSVIDKSLAPPLSGLAIAEGSEPVEHAIHVANVPIPLGAAVRSKAPVVEITCGDGQGHTLRIEPLVTSTIPYRARDTCQVVLHRERLRAEDGGQALQLSVNITSSDGSPRPDAHLEQRFMLRPSDHPMYFALGGATEPFDRITVRVAGAGDSLRDTPEEPRGAPQAQWSIVTGTDRARLYGTTAIPTGLFRLADTGHSGILTLSVGALLRLVALSRDGNAFPLGLEAGVMWLGVAGDVDPSVASRGAVAIVAGPGIAVPIANTSRATQTSINLHAWVEYEVSRTVLGQSGQAIGFVFGPSISIGDVGTNF